MSVNVLKFDYEIKKYALAHNQQFETKSPNRMKEHSGFKRFCGNNSVTFNGPAAHHKLKVIHSALQPGRQTNGRT